MESDDDILPEPHLPRLQFPRPALPLAPCLHLIFRHDFSRCEGRRRHGEIEFSLGSVNPEMGEVVLAVDEEQNWKDKLERNYLNEDCSQHFQSEDELLVVVHEEVEEGAVHHGDEHQQDGLVEGDDIRVTPHPDSRLVHSHWSSSAKALL